MLLGAATTRFSFCARERTIGKGETVLREWNRGDGTEGKETLATVAKAAEGLSPP